jgi:hypothetical protein
MISILPFEPSCPARQARTASMLSNVLPCERSHRGIRCLGKSSSRPNGTVWAQPPGIPHGPASRPGSSIPAYAQTSWMTTTPGHGPRPRGHGHVGRWPASNAGNLHLRHQDTPLTVRSTVVGSDLTAMGRFGADHSLATKGSGPRSVRLQNRRLGTLCRLSPPSICPSPELDRRPGRLIL